MISWGLLLLSEIIGGGGGGEAPALPHLLILQNCVCNGQYCLKRHSEAMNTVRQFPGSFRQVSWFTLYAHRDTGPIT